LFSAAIFPDDAFSIADLDMVLHVAQVSFLMEATESRWSVLLLVLWQLQKINKIKKMSAELYVFLEISIFIYLDLYKDK